MIQRIRKITKNLLSVVIMSTASKRFAFQLSPALAAVSRASVNVDVPAFGKGSAGIALDTEAGETTAEASAGHSIRR